MSNVENVCPQVLRGVARELRRLAANPPAGVKLVLREDDLTDVVAHIDGPADTPYAGGVFRVRLVLGREFPAAPPRAYFLTRIFHPNVAAATGEVCVNTLKRDWRPELGLEHALLAVKCLLIAPNAESALNAEAAALLRDRYDDYFARAKLLADIHARRPPRPPRPRTTPARAPSASAARPPRPAAATASPAARARAHTPTRTRTRTRTRAPRAPPRIAAASSSAYERLRRHPAMAIQRMSKNRCFVS
ncbi:ubiquitin-conjugating enzyme E2 S [Galleria mellonella]|uniref:Ubiquitin-conjugating enzyme E2 S n=1 Tax=Galleria mellonella TaxID=7137 RepID=A0ABM3MHJ7_GALME|nr:ubiquitin-conjugating enzyme E2 S [Galleria mellonella]